MQRTYQTVTKTINYYFVPSAMPTNLLELIIVAPAIGVLSVWTIIVHGLTIVLVIGT